MSAVKKPFVLGLILIFTFAFLVPGLYWPSSAQAITLPAVTTDSASNVDTNSARLNGTLDVGSSSVTEYGFYWATDNTPSNQEIIGNSLTAGHSFHYDLSDLDPGTTYYFQAYAKNSAGTKKSVVVESFTTLSSAGQPEVTTDGATDISSNDAALHATLDSRGSSTLTEYGFYWDTDSNPSTKHKVGTSISAGRSFSWNLTGLDADTKYYFQAYARNSYGYSYGDVDSFKTPSAQDKPSVSTNSPSAGNGYANLYGVVNSTGDSSIYSYGFYYGTSSSPGTKVEVGNDNISTNETFSYNLTGLSAGTTYYVKAYATNDQGTAYGSVLSFTSAASTAPSIFTIGSYTYNIRGSYIVGEAAPFIQNNRTYLPIRYVAYALGMTDANIFWNEGTQTVTLTQGATIVNLTIGSPVMCVNGSPVFMDVAPETVNYRTCLPIAWVVQAFGKTAIWNGYAQTVTIP